MTRCEVPSRSVELDIVFCDECKLSEQVQKGDMPDPPWREVTLDDWVGVMHACSDGCENGIRIRHEEGTPTDVEIPVMRDDEETTP